MGKIYSLISTLLIAFGAAYAADPKGYEWWYDSDYASRVAGNMAEGSDLLDLEIPSLPEGVHFFNCRVGAGEGRWGSVYRKMFLSFSHEKEDDEKGPLSYEYWYDSDYASKVTGKMAEGNNVLDIDITSNLEGTRCFNCRFGYGNGEWSTVYRKLIIFTEEEKDKNDPSPIIGYRHFINGIDLGYVEVEPNPTGLYVFEVSVADSVRNSVKDKTPIFDGDKVSIEGTDSVKYVFQFKTESSSGTPKDWNLEIPCDFSTMAVAMPVNSRHTFNTPPRGKLVAVKFTAGNVPLYFRSDIPIALDVYKDGEQVEEVSALQLAGMTMLELDAGEYFGILRDAESKSDQFNFQLMDVPNYLPTPRISFIDGMVEITCPMDGAVIHYSVDGTAPSTDSDDNIYTGSFSMERNGVIMAVAVMPGLDLEPSQIATYTVDSYKVATPTGSFDAATRLLTLSCETEAARIYYSFNPEEGWTKYGAPIEVRSNRTVYARATRDGYHDSEIAGIEVSEFKCGIVTISYNGRYVALSSDDPHATIMYSTDGSNPADGLTYTSPFDAAGLCNIRAMAVKDGYMDSDISGYEVTGYADKQHAVTSEGGVLRSCYEWADNDFTDNLRSLRVEGVLNDDDYAFLRSMNGLRHLDLEKVTDAQIPDRAFAGTGLIGISMPESVSRYGSGILESTANLCAVIWNSTTESLGARITADIDNPNVLLYVHPGVGVEDQRGLNVIEGSIAESIVLHYGYPYHAPRDFHASRVSMTRDFSLPTEIGRCGGWETLVLPFAPDAITHERAGSITPFAAWDGDADGARPFWLYASSAGGWWEARTIEACMPYIISMPNSPDYADAYNLAGRVTFSAGDVKLGPDTNEPMSTAWGSYRLAGVFMPVEDADVRVLNTSPEDGVMAGSMFVDYEEAVPFGAYVTGAGTRRMIPVFGDWNGLRIPVVENNGLTVDSPSHGTIRVHSTRDRRIDIITVDGMAVCTLSIRAGETVMVEDLMRNCYICGGIKVLVR